MSKKPKAMKITLIQIIGLKTLGTFHQTTSGFTDCDRLSV